MALGPIEAVEQKRKVYIVYMGSSTTSYVGSKAPYLKMLGDVFDGAPHPDKVSENLLYVYKSFQGCVAKLTKNETQKISKLQGVVSVFRNHKMKLDTTRSWDFMGFPVGVKRSNTESDVIVGVIDTGIWPESDSFDDEGLGPPPDKWKGRCQTANNFTCNNKIIGARYFKIDGSFGEEDIASPRDTDGHGTHTASTAAGVAVDEASYLGLGLGTARGGVPSARIAVYKVCWSDGCDSIDVLAAYDAAIADGVDILSVSLGFSVTRQYFRDPLAIGAFHALKKGILTSTSAGNSGPGLQSTTKGAPWDLSVAANTIDRKFVAKVQLGNGLVFEGIALNTFDLRNKTFPLIYGRDARNMSSFISSRSCSLKTLNRTLVEGKIILCESPNLGKGPFLADAAGMIIASRLNRDRGFTFPLPASFLDLVDGNRVRSYIVSENAPKGTILKSAAVNQTSAPFVPSFSSRGPNPISPGILKPDLSAPGVDILAAYSPIPSASGIEGDERFVSYKIISGTSMACPHATAVAAYIKSFHPTWSPTAIKSALMTTALPMSNSINKEAEFAYGSGQINPLKATDPGLIYDIEDDEYVKFLCREGLSETQIRTITGDDDVSCEGKIGTDNWTLNYPSIALPTTSVSFDAVFNRTVTNVGSANSIYKAKVNAIEGLVVKVEPSTLSFTRVAQKLSFSVRINGTIDRIKTLMSTTLVWDDGQHQVKSPIVVYLMS